MTLESTTQACEQCGFTYNCICSQFTCIEAPFKLVLLTHENEAKRKTNTGQLLLRCFTNAELIVWQRKMPEPELQNPYILYPNDSNRSIAEIKQRHTHNTQAQSTVEVTFVLIDATWQEANKMLNKTPWLKQLPKVEISTSKQSQYTLRRNQSSGHLCSFEVGVAMLSEWGDHHEKVTSLEHLFSDYQKVFQADQSGHKL